MLAPAFLLISQAGEVSVSHHEFSLISLAVVAVALVVIATLTTWAIVRRNPPIEREIDERIDKKLEPIVAATAARHKELHEEMLRLNHERRVTVANIFQKLEDYRKETKDDMGQLSVSIQKSFQDLNYSIGRLEGQRKGEGV